MIRIAVTEDEECYVDYLLDCLQKFQKEEQTELEIKIFRDGEELIDEYDGSYDIILMDIEMRFMNGMEAAERIRKQDEQVEIIFVTNMAQFAIQGYKVRALDYIVKPVEYIPFHESLKRAIRNIDKKKADYITINSRAGLKKINVIDIVWIESHGHRLTFNLKEDSYKTTVYSMKEMENKLKDCGFSRCNSGILVNLRYVTGITDGQVVVNGTHLPLSRGRKNEFMEAMVSYMNH